MEFRIADTFTDSLARLTGNEQKAVKTTAFDLQLNPVNPGMQFHKLDRAKDPNFWSVRVNQDIRIIVHRTASSLMLCYVDHHDDAYDWGERRKIERHPRTGAAQLVEVRERVEEVTVYRPAVEPASSARTVAAVRPLLFAAISDDALLGYGVPADWLVDVRQATEDTLLDLADHLPREASEALLDLATGVTPALPVAAPPETDPFSHPDAQRRFRILTNVRELERALDYPWEKWTVFLHPAQQAFVERDYGGPARVSGSAGTGKTIVALHRAVHLARRHPAERVLLTTFSPALANALKTKLNRLIGNEPQIHGRIVVTHVLGLGHDLYKEKYGEPKIAPPDLINSLLAAAAQVSSTDKFSAKFLWSEWSDIADAWQLKTWEEYRDLPRLGRKTRVGGKQRERLWAIFSEVRMALKERGVITWAEVFGRLTQDLREAGTTPFRFAVIDEAQDLGVAPLRFLAALGADRENSLFFAGDLGQRIFQTPFSWKALGVNVSGRSQTLRINYRTSHQIRAQADRLLPQSLADVDGNVESRRGTVSVFNGPPPAIEIFDTPADETGAVAAWISTRMHEGFLPHELGVFVRAEPQVHSACSAVKEANADFVVLTDEVEATVGKVSISTMHLAKGLEFRGVVVMACDDEVLPLQERIESVSDASDLEEVYNTERHLLYVACTRARDQLFITGVKPASEFIGDMSPHPLARAET
jgi:mRNA-degrading endonuclease RelE of RelBE toxin-antitoxin system